MKKLKIEFVHSVHVDLEGTVARFMISICLSSLLMNSFSITLQNLHSEYMIVQYNLGVGNIASNMSPYS